jgi:glycogen operon protein
LGSYESHTLAGTVRLLGYPLLLHFIVNTYCEALEFELPALGEAQESWPRCVDTSLNRPDDICRWADAQRLQGPTCLVQPRSVVLLGAGGISREATTPKSPQ